MQEKTVLQISTTYQAAPGRIMEMIQQLGEENEFKMIGAIGRGQGSNNVEYISIGSKWDIYKHVVITRIFDKHGFGSKKATIDFINKVKEIDPDIIHLHNIHGYYINIEILFDYLKEANKPVVWTLHDCWSFTGHCAYFDYAGCEKWKTGCHSCPENKAYPSSMIFDNSKTNYINKKDIFTGVKNLNIVTPSQWLADLVQESFLNEYPVKVINNGIDLNVYKPTESSFREKYNLQYNFIILGVASTWDRRKGLKYFVEMSKVLEKDERIVLVGLSEKQLKEIPNNIIGISRTNNVEELVEIYSSADVFVNPTLEDNFPTTNLEALACGTPVITFNTGGSVESVDENTGFIVEKGNIIELTNLIKDIKKKGKTYFTNRCIFRVAELYEKTDKFNEYIDLYKKK